MATPTDKDTGIDNLLKSVLGISLLGEENPRRNAIENAVCVFCHEPATTFKDALSEKEFTISGICQICQDELFD